jgi:hypothetical protein
MTYTISNPSGPPRALAPDRPNYVGAWPDGAVRVDVVSFDGAALELVPRPDHLTARALGAAPHGLDAVHPGDVVDVPGAGPLTVGRLPRHLDSRQADAPPTRSAPAPAPAVDADGPGARALAQLARAFGEVSRGPTSDFTRRRAYNWMRDHLPSLVDTPEHSGAVPDDADGPGGELVLAPWVDWGEQAPMLATAASSDAAWTREGVELGTFPEPIELLLEPLYDGDAGRVRVSWRTGVPNPPGWRLSVGAQGHATFVLEIPGGPAAGEVELDAADLGFDPLTAALAYRFEALEP